MVTNGKSKQNISYFVKRQEVFLGKTLRFGEASNLHLRLSNSKEPWVRPVHEVWNVSGEKRVLKSPLIHQSPDGIGSFVEKLNTYTSQNARYLYEQNIPASWLDIILYPPAKFFQNFFLRQGFRDGTHGFVHALLMSFHSFLSRSKLWFLYKNNSKETA